MTEVRFHRDLYAAAAVDEAVKVFEKYGRFERVEDPPYRVVRVVAKTPARERQIVRELGNHALGLTRRDEVAP